MAKKVAPVPKGYRTVTPYLVVRGADAALAYYADVFGAEILSRIYADDQYTVLHAEMKIGNSIIIISDEMPAFGIYSPLDYGSAGVSQHLYLPDVEQTWEKAVEAGCTVLVPLADTHYGERFAKIADPFGHVWSLSKRIGTAKGPKTQKNADGFSIYEPVGHRVDQPYPTADGASDINSSKAA
ncbi:MAG: VOC family protein [Rhodospirillales bacterium]